MRKVGGRFKTSNSWNVLQSQVQNGSMPLKVVRSRSVVGLDWWSEVKCNLYLTVDGCSSNSCFSNLKNALHREKKSCMVVNPPEGAFTIRIHSLSSVHYGLEQGKHDTSNGKPARVLAFVAGPQHTSWALSRIAVCPDVDSIFSSHGVFKSTQQSMPRPAASKKM